MNDLRNSLRSRSANKLQRDPTLVEADAAVRHIEVGEAHAGQRIDNFLIRVLKGVPRSHVYRLIRDGQVRINGARCDNTRRLALGERVRVPPVRVSAPVEQQPRPLADGDLSIVLEDEWLVVIDKPAGMAVHGGSGIAFGAIERLRAARPGAPMLELVHRLDRETSGLLMFAKKRSALTALHAAWGDGSIKKRYTALTLGSVAKGRQVVDAALRKYVGRDGERRVSVDPNGQRAVTIVLPQKIGERASLVTAELQTGRTHQIRVHLAHLGHPILGDPRYGDFAANREWARAGLRRMFLHAGELRFVHPGTGRSTVLTAPLPADLAGVIQVAFDLRETGTPSLQTLSPTPSSARVSR
jgi:23S rRNA pseudouridine955/2504/2580 synthase